MSNVDLKSLIGVLNPYCKRHLEASAAICVNRGHYEVTVEHMLQSLLEEPEGDLHFIILRFGRDPARLKRAILGALEECKTGNHGRPVFSPFLIRLIGRAWMIASVDFKQSEVRSGMLFLALLEDPGRYCTGEYTDLLDGFSQEELRKNFFDICANSCERKKKAVVDGWGRTAAEARAGKPASGNAPEGEVEEEEEGDDSPLKRFATNFTERARHDLIDPVFGRDREIRQMIDILARRRKNNPIVVGDAGVGKTALAEGLAVRIVQGDVPDVLKGVEIICLDLGLLQAGAGAKGEFENRLKDVINQVKSSPTPIILFIDEAHTIIGAGGQEGGSDAANLLKPALARGELRTIAATTWAEYKKYFERDAALSRRFQLIKVDEPDVDATATMLRGLRSRFEKAHGLIIRDDAIYAAAALGTRYISGRQQPDKGVDLIDTAGARVKIGLTSKPNDLEDQERKIATLQRELDALEMDSLQCGIDAQVRIEELHAEIAAADAERQRLDDIWQNEKAKVDRVLNLRKQVVELKENLPKGEPMTDELKALTEELKEALAELRELQGKNPLMNVEVTPEIIARVISDWTGIPLGKMVRDEAEVLLHFKERLGERIKGQDHVLDAVGTGIRAAKAGLKNPKTPMGVFLFVGPSGVGKTETGLGVAEMLFGGERFLTTINMSEFQEKHTVSRLIGSPPGYIGYGEGGVLTEAVRQRPYSVVLLDEAEKCHPEVLNLFYQVFDKGMLADGQGRIIDFKDTVIFLTVNLGAEKITALCEGGQRPDPEVLIRAVRPILSKHFKPALLARMTIVPFYPIHEDVMRDITRLKLKQLGDRLMESHKMYFVVDEKVIEAIAARCTEVETGARNIDHIMTGTLLPQISTEILKQMSEGDLPAQLNLGLDEKGNFTFKFGPRTNEVALSTASEKETDTSEVSNIDFDDYLKTDGEA